MNIAVIGITSNPAHIGHINLIKEALNNFNKVILHVAYKPAWKDNILPYRYRNQMLRNILYDFKLLDKVILSNVEEILSFQNNGAKIYTVDVVKYLQRFYPSKNKFTLIFGQDNQNDLIKFKDYDFLKNNCNFLFFKENQEHKLHSSDIRNIFMNNKENEDLIKYLGKTNYKFIKENNLYKE